jgi:fructokinase
MTVDGVRIGIDLGGTKIEGLALSPNGEELARLRRPTPRGYDATLGVIMDTVLRLEADCGSPCSVGVGIPGALSARTGLVKNANSTWLIGHAIDRDLSVQLERPVRVMNDANCFALSEATDGAARDGQVVFGVILGTGVGGGIVVRERLLEGAQSIAGEWGHNPLPWSDDSERPGSSCYCGKRGCIETFLSGPGMVLDHRTATGRDWTTHEIAAALELGDEGATAAYRRYVDRLARGLASVVNILDPDVVVLGGGMSNLPGLATQAQTALGRWVFSDQSDTRVVRNLHGDSSGVRGAAWLWPTTTES